MKQVKPSWMGAGFIGLTQLSAPLAPALWGWLYNRLASGDRAGELLFMNYGYAEDSFLMDLKPNDEAFRYPIQLYAQVIRGIDLKAKDVLEVGCGRGGGGSFLIRYYQPHSYTGVDLSGRAIAWCKETHVLPGAQWLQGRADILPLSDASVDVVVNVESSHCYPSMADFLTEVYRVLRPGGYFAFCDLRSKVSAQRLDQQLADSGLKKLEKRTITPHVLQALDQLSQGREHTIIAKMPRFVRAAFRDFIAIKHSGMYNMLMDGQMVYVHYLLQKPD